MSIRTAVCNIREHMLVGLYKHLHTYEIYMSYRIDMDVKEKITLTIDTTIIDKIDRERGDVTRSTYVQRLLEKVLKLPKL